MITTSCESVLRHVGVPDFKGHGDTLSSAGTSAHVVHGGTPRDEHSAQPGTFHTPTDHSAGSACAYVSVLSWVRLEEHTTTSSAVSAACLWPWQPSQSLALLKNR